MSALEAGVASASLVVEVTQLAALALLKSTDEDGNGKKPTGVIALGTLAAGAGVVVALARFFAVWGQDSRMGSDIWGVVGISLLAIRLLPSILLLSATLSRKNGALLIVAMVFTALYAAWDIMLAIGETSNWAESAVKNAAWASWKANRGASASPTATGGVRGSAK